MRRLDKTGSSNGTLETYKLNENTMDEETKVEETPEEVPAEATETPAEAAAE